MSLPLRELGAFDEPESTEDPSSIGEDMLRGNELKSVLVLFEDCRRPFLDRLRILEAGVPVLAAKAALAPERLARMEDFVTFGACARSSWLRTL